MVIYIHRVGIRFQETQRVILANPSNFCDFLGISYRNNQQVATVLQNLLFKCFLIAQHVSSYTQLIIRNGNCSFNSAMTAAGNHKRMSNQMLQL
jgi:hypothetical protein